MPLDAHATQMFEIWRERAELLLGGSCELKDCSPRLHQGWELDEWIWLVDRNGEQVILTTNHGNLITPSKAPRSGR